MSSSLLVLGSIVLLLAAIFLLRIPIALLLMLIGVAGYALLDGPGNAVSMLGNEFWSIFSGPGLTVIPLFVLMGQLCYHSGLSGRLYKSVAAFAGHRKGGVAVATMLACGGFSAICGSNTATAATMSVIALPEMKKYHYNQVFASGVVAAGTTLGAVIPPSVVAIVLGVQTGVSIRKLFMGGILPGILLLLLFILTIFCITRLKPDWSRGGERLPLAERLRGLPGFIEALLLFGLVVGGLSAGLFTPTEAGAAGTGLALLIGFGRRLVSIRAGRNGRGSAPERELTLRGAWRAAQESMQVSAMIFLLLAGAGCYGKFLALSRTPFMVAEGVAAFSLGPLAVLLLIFLVYLIGGMFMDALALLLITIPIFLPLVVGMNIDPVWFCLVLLVVTTMGAITPPVGASSYVVSAMGRIPLADVFKGSLWFLPAFLICIAVMLLLPDVFTFLPDLMV